MATYNSDSLILESALTANDLPDPVGAPQRTHWLSNTGGSPVTWTSVGATPFTVAGVNVASLVIPAGQVRTVQSDGTRWVVAPSASRRTFAGTAVTNGSGDAVFTFTPAFPAAPDVVSGIQAAGSNNPIDYRVTALTASSCTINVRQSPIVVILSISVVGASAPLSGATVHLIATEPGQGV